MRRASFAMNTHPMRSFFVFLACLTASCYPGYSIAGDVALLSNQNIPIVRLVGPTFHEVTAFKEHKSQFGSRFEGSFLGVKNNMAYRLKLGFGSKLGFLTTQPFEIPKTEGKQYVRIYVSVIKGRTVVQVGVLEPNEETVELLGKGKVQFTTRFKPPINEKEYTVTGCTAEELGAPRDWTDTQGRILRGGYMYQDESDVFIKVQRSQGPTTTKAPKTTLSPADQDFLKVMLKTESAAKDE